MDINEFRYDGPKPKTREAAIVMLADTIEAAVRSMKDPTPKGIDQFIERLVRGKLEDGQLSECPLSLSDIDKICDAFSGILKGVYHERIEYPTVHHYATQDAASTDSPDKAKESETIKETGAETIKATIPAETPVSIISPKEPADDAAEQDQEDNTSAVEKEERHEA